jgi:hypothetical protein
MEQNTMKRLDENRISADGIIWDNRSDKSIKVKNTDTGFLLHSIKMEGIAYYPAAIDRVNKNKNYIQIIEKEKA